MLEYKLVVEPDLPGLVRILLIRTQDDLVGGNGSKMLVPVETWEEFRDQIYTQGYDAGWADRNREE
jgi:hypothetical protein